MNIEPPVRVTSVPDSGNFDTNYYDSSKDNIILQRKNKNVSEYDTQLKYITDVIKKLQDEFEKPVKIFRDPLKARILDDTKWEDIDYAE